MKFFRSVSVDTDEVFWEQMANEVEEIFVYSFPPIVFVEILGGYLPPGSDPVLSEVVSEGREQSLYWFSCWVNPIGKLRHYF